MFKFRRKPRKPVRSPETIELVKEFRLGGPHNYHSVHSQFLSNALPDSEYEPYPRKMLFSHLPEAEVNQSLKDFIAGEIQQEELSQRVFGLSYAEIVEHTHEEERINRSAAAPSMLDKLSHSTISEEWLAYLDDDRPHPFVAECLGDAASRCATWSNLPYDGWDFGDEHAPVYAEAARIGFMAVAAHYKRATSHFQWEESPKSRKLIVGCAVITRPTMPHPLHVLPHDQKEEVRSRCGPLARRLQRLGFDDPGYPRTSFADSLWGAAEHGAMIAAIGLDPSNCIVYGTDGQPVKREQMPWLRRRLP